jgi:hypothetical protein
MEPDRPQSAIRYVIVVHGMGEQVKNASSIGVVSRLAEARRQLRQADADDVVTLGKAASQTGIHEDPTDLLDRERPWMEFEGIPQQVSCDLTAPFVGQPSDSGENLRFVDICWSRITQSGFDDIGQDAQVWANSLLGRLRRRNDAIEHARHVSDAALAKLPPWIFIVLELLVRSLVVVHRLTAWRSPKADKLIYEQYLGDVQAYGEYSQCRGRAARYFHEVMAQVEMAHQKWCREHDDNREARYTVIAHSLGTIMSLDGLIYAAVPQDVRIGKRTCGLNLPFDGYLGIDADCQLHDIVGPGTIHNERRSVGASCPTVPLEELVPKTNWIERVDAFVTLGSPIDKFLILWPENYQYLVDEAWTQSEPNGHTKIRHFNYCESQDPVGHNVVVAKSTPAYQRLFEAVPQEDRVYTRSAWPGLAHVAYFKDLDLFKWILRRAIDDVQPGNEGQNKFEAIEWFCPSAHLGILAISYLLVPLIVTAFSHYTLYWAFSSTTAQSAVMPAFLFVIVCWLGGKLLQLMIWWRRLLVTKIGPTQVVSTRSQRILDWAFYLALFVVPLLLAAAARLCTMDIAAHEPKIVDKAIQVVAAPMIAVVLVITLASAFDRIGWFGSGIRNALRAHPELIFAGAITVAFALWILFPLAAEAHSFTRQLLHFTAYLHSDKPSETVTYAMPAEFVFQLFVIIAAVVAVYTSALFYAVKFRMWLLAVQAFEFSRHVRVALAGARNVKTS